MGIVPTVTPMAMPCIGTLKEGCLLMHSALGNHSFE
jgi:hypothetical protein